MRSLFRNFYPLPINICVPFFFLSRILLPSKIGFKRPRMKLITWWILKPESIILAYFYTFGLQKFEVSFSKELCYLSVKLMTISELNPILDIIKRERYHFQMSANRLNVLVTLMLAVALLVTESGNAQVDVYTQFDSTSKRTSAPQKYCGKKLSNALQIICDGVYNSMFKKNGQGEFQSIGENILIARHQYQALERWY